jgi:hypothetical protein
LQTAGTNAVTYDANQNATHTGYISAPNTFGFKNRLINGDMRIDQRNSGASVTVGSGNPLYCLDRWLNQTTQASKFTVQQMNSANTSASNYESNSTPAGYTNSAKITSSSSYSISSSDYFTFCQRIEGYNIADFNWGTANAQTVTLSFWVKSSLTGTFGGVLSSNNNYCYTFTYTINSANTWQYVTITIPGPTSSSGGWQTNNLTGIQVIWGLGVGSTYSGTANTWSSSTYLSATGATSVVGTSGATWYITGAQLEVGSKATPFDMRDYGTELTKCQRYLELHGDVSSFYVSPAAGYSSLYRGYVGFKVTKRAVPTVTTYGPGGYPSSSGQMDVDGVGNVSITVNVFNTCGFRVSGLGSPYSGQGGYKAEAEL